MYVRHQQGRLGELVSLIEQAVADNPGIPAFRPVLASAHLEAGNDVTALGLLESAAADGFASLPSDFLWMMGATFHAMVAVELRATGPARKLYDLLAPYHDQVPFIGTLGFFPVALDLGGLASVLGRYEEAEASFVEATELNTRGQMTVLRGVHRAVVGADAGRPRGAAVTSSGHGRIWRGPGTALRPTGTPASNGGRRERSRTWADT